MFLKRGLFDSHYDRLAEKIKKELMDTLQKKGVVISKIKVDMDTDKMNLSMNIKER